MTDSSNLDNVSPDTTNATVDQLDLSYILNASWRTFVDRWQSIAGVTLWGMLYGAVGLLVISVAVVALVIFGISSNAFPALATLLLIVLGIIALISLLFLGGWI